MFENNKISIVLGLLCVFLTGQVIVQGQDIRIASNNTYNIKRQLLDQWKTLKTESNTRNIVSAKRFVDSIDEEWVKENRNDYAELMKEICDDLSRLPLWGNKLPDNALIREYALKALDKPDEIFILLELDLIGYLQPPLDIKAREAFAEERKENTAKRLHCLKRWMDSIDPSWINGKAREKLLPYPREVYDSTGQLMLQSITDPDLMRKCKEITKHNAQIIKIDNEQSLLRQEKDRFMDEMKRIVEYYSLVPYNTEELKELLNEYDIDKKMASEMLNTVRAKINGK
jgi:hypothetical protein